MTLKWSPDFNPPAQGHLIYTIDTTTGGTTPSNVDFNLRSTGTVDYKVVWETSVEETSTSNTLLHTYGSPGTYDVQVFPTGSYRPYFNNVSADVDQITKVSIGGAVDLGNNLKNAWFDANNITEFECNYNSTARVGNFENSWRNCTSLASFPLVDTSSVTTFFNTWNNCTSLTSFPLVDTSSVTNFGSAWRTCTSLTSFPLLDISSATNIGNAWNGCSSLTSFPLLNTSSITSLAGTWRDCSSLTSFPLLDTSSVTNFSDAWNGCSSLTSFPQINSSSGTNFNEAWYGCSSLTSFQQIDTSSGTNFTAAWRDCSSLTSFPLLNVSNSTVFTLAWSGDTNLTDFPANFFDSWTGTPATNCFNNAWNSCSSLTATSVENILNSIDTSGQSAPAAGPNITIDFNAASGTPNITTAVSNLKSLGWTITLNGVLQ